MTIYRKFDNHLQLFDVEVTHTDGSIEYFEFAFWLNTEFPGKPVGANAIEIQYETIKHEIIRKQIYEVKDIAMLICFGSDPNSNAKDKLVLQRINFE